ncbi:MAG: VWA domain-containing protein [Pyrinomonadaceae bacterium]|nr:VWA domain-containing protein [Pyrinomonadaceae bacterium]
MKIKILLTILFALFISSAAMAQETPPPTPTPEIDTEDIVRISSELVLVDTLVLDKDGNQVTDLTADDFEVLQDGKPQRITNFTYISGEAGMKAERAKTDKKALPLPPVNVRSNQARIITFVIDDGNCLATPEGLALARDGVKKFISEQMQPSDRVAIYRTRGGSSLLQMYTSNKEILRRTINKARWFPSGCGSAFEATRSDATAKIMTGEGKAAFDDENTKEFKADAAQMERNNQVRGSFGVLNFVIDRLKVLPQRKIVFFVSEGIPITFGGDDTIRDGLRQVADNAIRASVVFYTVSEKGLSIPGMFEARDEVADETVREARIEEERSLNSGLAYLAYQTGGDFIKNKNFIESELVKVLRKESGYYLLGYQPESGTFNGKDFHKITVRVKRDGLRISSRKGFYGREEEVSKKNFKNANSPLYQAIASPFQENGMDIRLTTMTGNDAKTGNFVRAIFHVNGDDLTLVDDVNGMKKVVLDVVGVILDEKGKVVEEFNRTSPIRIPERGVATVKQFGLDYSSDLPVKKPGFYSFRLAVRDETSKRVGSAGDYVEIGNVKKDKFFISGLITTSISADGKPVLPKSRPVEAAFSPVFTTGEPSIRQYQAGVPFAYSFTVYNPDIDRSSGQPRLTAQYRIFKDGEMLAESPEKPVEAAMQTDRSRIEDYGILRLNQGAATGEYILQLIIRDKVSNKTSTQWIDFELIP